MSNFKITTVPAEDLGTYGKMFRAVNPISDVIRVEIQEAYVINSARVEWEYHIAMGQPRVNAKYIKALNDYRDRPIFIADNVWIFEDGSVLTGSPFGVYNVHAQPTDVVNERYHEACMVCGELGDLAPEISPAARQVRKYLRKKK